MIKLILHMTTGRGPIECEYFLTKTYAKLTAFLQQEGLSFKEISLAPGEQSSTYQSITIGLHSLSSLPILTPWIGSLLWICKSPFRPQCKRKNWFIQLNVYEPSVSNATLSSNDIKIDTFRSQGKGGQHVNKTNSAIRVTHIPTGLVVVSQDERSQHRNKESALVRLQLKLDLLHQTNQMKTARELRDQHDLIKRGQAVKVFVGEKLIEQVVIRSKDKKKINPEVVSMMRVRGKNE